MAREGWTVTGQEGHDPVSTQADGDAGPIRRALISVYDKTGLEELARALHEAGVEIVSTGSTAARIAAAGRAGDPGRGADRIPGDASTAGSRRCTRRVHAGLLADLRLDSHVAQLDELGIAPFELLVSNLYPFTRDGRVGRERRRVRRADRHRRPGDGPRRRQEPPQRRGGDSPAAYAEVVTALARAASRWPSGGGWRREAFAAHRRVRRRGGRLVRRR